MKEDSEFLNQMFKRVSKIIGKPYSAVEPFEQELRKNWYDTPQAIKNISDQQFQKMGIPLRVVAAIRDEVKLILGKSIQSVGLNINNQSLSESVKNKEIKQKPPIINQNELNQAKILSIVQKLQNKLLEKYPWVGNQMVKIVQTLHKIIKNIVSDSYELKFRVLKKSNQKIKEIILSNPPVVAFMKQIGFEQDQQTLILNSFETASLFFVQECLSAVLNNHSQQNQEQNQHFEKIPQKQQKREDLFLPVDLKLPQNSTSVSLQGAFSKQSLDDSNYAQVLDKLLSFRKKIMSTAPKNRQLKIYHKKFEIKQTNFVVIDMESQMQMSDNAILGKYWKQVIKTSQNKAKFQSRRKAEFQFLIQQQVYRETTIKLRLPNELIIEGRFGPLETLSDVYKVVAQIIIGQFYIYQAPPVKNLDKEMHRTLDSLDSVPSGSFYIGLRTEWYIRNQYAKMIRQ